MGKQSQQVERRVMEFSMSLVNQAKGIFDGISSTLRYKHAVRYLYQPREDDLFVVTFPKSGSTLMQMMLYQMTSDGNMEIPHINSVAPWFEHEITRGRVARLESLPSPRFFKSHLQYSWIPKGRKIIYVVRDVRDVAVSAYHHSCLLTGQQPPLEKYIDDFLQGKPSVLSSSWFEHVSDWLPHRNDPNVLFLRYEQITVDLPSTVQAVSNFWNVSVAPKDLPRVLARCGIDFMKQYNGKFDPRLQSALSSAERQFIRKGLRGEGRSVFSSEQNRMLNRLLEKMAGKLGASKGDDLTRILRSNLDLDLDEERAGSGRASAPSERAGATAE